MPARKTHKHPQDFYGKLYGVSRASIARMVGAGVDPDDVVAVDQYLRTRTKARLGLAELRIKRGRPFGS